MSNNYINMFNGLKNTLSRHKAIVLFTIKLSALLHLAVFVMLYNQRNVEGSPLYCNANFAQVLSNSDKDYFSVELDKPLKDEDPAKLFPPEDDSDSPAGKFSSSFHANGKHKDLIKRLHRSAELRPQGGKKGNSKYGLRGGRKGGYPRIFEDILPGESAKKSYIYRKRQYQDIVVREVLPTLYTIDQPFKNIIKDATEDLKKHNQRNHVIEDFRTWQKGIDPKEFKKVELIYGYTQEGKTPLRLSKKERMKYLDKTLKSDKELQLKDFIRKYFHHDPNEGDLAETVRDLYYENLQRLAYQFSSDQTYFMLDYFQENLNKEDFLKNSLAQVAKLKGSRVATELLFTIENIYDIQGRAVRLLFKFIHLYPGIPKEKKNRLRTETLRRTMKRYKPLLSKKKILDENMAFNIYAKKRLEIIDYLIEQTPRSYRLKDALFERGKIYWEMARNDFGNSQNLRSAIQAWSKIADVKGDSGDFLNEEAYQQVRVLLDKLYVRSPEQDTPSLNYGAIVSVNNALNSHLNEQLTRKRKREDRLLWP